MNEWAKEVQATDSTFLDLFPILTVDTQLQTGSAPNFISDIFYLTSAINHYGLNRTLQSFEDLHKQADELQKHIDQLTTNMASLQPGVKIILYCAYVNSSNVGIS